MEDDDGLGAARGCFFAMLVTVFVLMAVTAVIWLVVR